MRPRARATPRGRLCREQGVFSSIRRCEVVMEFPDAAGFGDVYACAERWIQAIRLNAGQRYAGVVNLERAPRHPIAATHSWNICRYVARKAKMEEVLPCFTRFDRFGLFEDNSQLA